MPGVMSKAHIDGFLDEIKRVNPGFAESKSSLMGLLRHLRNSSANPAAMTLLQAKQFCVNPNDRRLVKYDAAHAQAGGWVARSGRRGWARPRCGGPSLAG